jgi:hypothetical protein
MPISFNNLIPFQRPFSLQKPLLHRPTRKKGWNDKKDGRHMGCKWFYRYEMSVTRWQYHPLSYSLTELQIIGPRCLVWKGPHCNWVSSVRGFWPSGLWTSSTGRTGSVTFPHEHQLNIAFTTPSSVVIKALCYKPEGRGFDTRWGELLLPPNSSNPDRLCGLVVRVPGCISRGPG